MGSFDNENVAVITPLPEEISEARNHPNEWVYRIAGNFLPHEGIPPEAIIGVWTVNGVGEIVGTFMSNAKYDPNKYPVK